MANGRFGTDGVRGVANTELSADLALALGRAAAQVVPAPAYVIGRDTRRSGPLLSAALAAGLASVGVDVVDVGVLPTPGVAFCAEQRGWAAAVVSASHNPYQDNGIKLFGPGGTKLSEETERAVERALDTAQGGPWPTADGVGDITLDGGAAEAYAAHLVGALDGRRLDGLTVVLDCANGAASAIAPAVFASLGAAVTAIAAHPDGTNINDRCGSTHPDHLARAVTEHGADLGLAFDGDADRLVAVDHAGAVADGDTLLALFAVDLAARGELVGDAVVVTVMSNLGLRMAMDRHGIGVFETAVGDRQVLSALEDKGLVLGGEQSGHLVFRHRATTGDGILTGLLLADLVARAARPLADLSAGLVERVPQLLVNVAVAEPDRLDEAEAVWEAVAAAQAELGDTGRVLLRASGTEPVVRVMVEALTHGQAERIARRICAEVEAALGAAGTGR